MGSDSDSQQPWLALQTAYMLWLVGWLLYRSKALGSWDTASGPVLDFGAGVATSHFPKTGS